MHYSQWGHTGQPTRETLHWGSLDDKIFIEETLNPYFRSGKTYVYLFRKFSKFNIYPEWMEADHTSELIYVFGRPFAVSNLYYSKL